MSSWASMSTWHSRSLEQWKMVVRNSNTSARRCAGAAGPYRRTFACGRGTPACSGKRQSLALRMPRMPNTVCAPDDLPTMLIVTAPNRVRSSYDGVVEHSPKPDLLREQMRELLCRG